MVVSRYDLTSSVSFFILRGKEGMKPVLKDLPSVFRSMRIEIMEWYASEMRKEKLYVKDWTKDRGSID